MLLSNPDWGDMVWCPSNGHGGNGRFYDPATVQEGYESVSSGLTAAQERALRAQGQELRDAAAPKAEAPAPAPKAPRDPRACECECGGMTKGGRFIPGHDAKLHARQKAEAKAKAEALAKEDVPD